MSQVECPYCEHVFEPDCEDGCDAGFTYEEVCESCGKIFIFTPVFEVVLNAKKADCLNGGEHNYSKWYCIKRDSESTIYARDCFVCEKSERKTE